MVNGEEHSGAVHRESLRRSIAIRETVGWLTLTLARVVEGSVNWITLDVRQ
jgi:hypothetical protein